MTLAGSRLPLWAVSSAHPPAVGNRDLESASACGHCPLPAPCRQLGQIAPQAWEGIGGAAGSWAPEPQEGPEGWRRRSSRGGGQLGGARAQGLGARALVCGAQLREEGNRQAGGESRSGEDSQPNGSESTGESEGEGVGVSGPESEMPAVAPCAVQDPGRSCTGHAQRWAPRVSICSAWHRLVAIGERGCVPCGVGLRVQSVV